MGTNFNFKSFGNDSAADAAAGRPPGGFGLARQTSIYSLTFDELQNTMGGSLGKDFGSMNMDELLKNIWSAEETQSMAAAAAAAAAASSGTAEGLQRQGSLTLPRTLSQKTVDEVWRELSKEYVVSGSGIGGAGAGAGGGGGGAGGGGNVSRRQHTLGEITLEEFLVKAGVVREDMPPMGGGVVNNGNNNSNNGTFFGFQQNRGVGLSNNSDITSNQIHIQPSNLPLSVNGVRSNQPQIVQQQQQQQQPQQIFPKQPNVGYMTQMGMQNSPGIRTGLAGIGDQGIGGGGGGGGMGMVGLGGVPLGSPANHLMKSPVNQISSDGVAKSNGDLSSVSPVLYPFNGNLRGRRAGGAVEKVVERRQRRMIKNRESAARSRARKQAYTMELEAEIAKLKEENEELRKKQEEIMEMQKNQVMEMMNSQQGSKKRLRRTQTGPW